MNIVPMHVVDIGPQGQNEYVLDSVLRGYRRTWWRTTPELLK